MHFFNPVPLMGLVEVVRGPLLRQYVQAGRLGRKSGRGFHEYS
jgi:3-hydroxyacyl-CoA dehydrogenase